MLYFTKIIDFLKNVKIKIFFESVIISHKKLLKYGTDSESIGQYKMASRTSKMLCILQNFNF